MTWHKPFSDSEVEYIERHYPHMSCSEMGEKLGRSEQGVRNVVKKLGLPQRRARAAEGAQPAALGRLRMAPARMAGKTS